MRWLGISCVLVAAVALACAPRTPRAKLVAWRADAVSKETWERVRPHIEALAPGDDLRIFEAAREVYVLKRRSGDRPVVVIPAWITSLSGGAAGGASLLGQLVSRSGDTVYGSHVFGYVMHDRIVPRYQLLTAATLLDAEGFLQASRDRAPGLGALPRPGGTLYFRDLYVVAGRPLEFREPASRASAGSADVAAFYSEAAYRRVSPVLDSLPVGTDLFSMLWLLGAEFVSDDYGETHRLRAPGFLHYKEVRTVTLEAPDGVTKLRPFGWVEGEREVVKRVAVFHNDRLRAVVPYTGFADLTPYLRAAAAPAAPGAAD